MNKPLTKMSPEELLFYRIFHPQKYRAVNQELKRRRNTDKPQPTFIRKIPVAA